MASWTFAHFDILGEERFNNLCLSLLRVEISPEIQPTNKKGADDGYDAFLEENLSNRYDATRNGLWWFQFKFNDNGKANNTGRNLKKEFKNIFKRELEKIIKKDKLPQNYYFG